MKNFSTSIAAFAFCLAPMSIDAAAAKVDAAIAPYKKDAQLEGSLNSIGSDTLDKLMHAWAKGFMHEHPALQIKIEGKGSVTAPPALTEGDAQLGPMSREMRRKEREAFEKKHGYAPTAIPVAVDALAVFVHKDNPLKGLTLSQVDGIFSRTRKLGGVNISNWDQLSTSGKWQGKPINLYGRNLFSGTHGFFSDHALDKGELKGTVKQQPGSEAVVKHVSDDYAGIGYSGIGYISPGVKAVALGQDERFLYEPSQENCLNGDYPLARSLFIYVNKKPGTPLDKATHDFLKFVLSKQGQEIVVQTGFFPLTKKEVSKSLANLEN